MKRILFSILFIIPAILGCIGYLQEGILFRDALYGSVSLYVLNMKYDSANILAEIARWMAPIMTASGLILAIKSIFFHLRDRMICLYSDATAIYGDGVHASRLWKEIKHSVLSTQEIKKGAGYHIIMFENDIDNVAFYQSNKDFFADKKVYMHLKDMNSYLLKESNVNFFNPYEIIAREYWKSRNFAGVLGEEKLTADVAIVGFGPLGQRLLQYGLLNNIYSPDQKITYHIFGESILYEKTYPSFDMMNEDCIVYHGSDWKQNISLFSAMERIILTERPDLDLVQALLYTCRTVPIDYCCDGNIRLKDFYKSDQIQGYGDEKDVYTEENIKTDHLYRRAMELNYKYESLYGDTKGKDKEKAMQDLWNGLDGFTKGSNIASADYHHIRCMIMKQREVLGKPMTPEELAEAEHIRWCRFHYLNHWTYGIPENGKNKDPKQKIHKCLVPFKDLPEEEKQKDVEAVNLMLELLA